jgi:thymidylate synthase (FAD)
MNKVKILTGDPTVVILAEMQLRAGGVGAMAEWVREHRPECLPEGYDGDWTKLFPHDGKYAPGDGMEPLIGGQPPLTDNELLVELAGRKCYDSFGERAGRRTNAEYIANTQAGDVPHASILYHAKFSFFFAGISRRVSHELIRNYVGADRDEEGAPSQESTRFTHHYGYFVCPPRYLREDQDVAAKGYFESCMQVAYDNYLGAVSADCEEYRNKNGGAEPKGIEKKRIYEAASSFLPHQAETSFVWTTNPAAIAKLCRERDNDLADLEMRRFARKLKRVVVSHAPNLFPQPWMREVSA